MMIRLRALVSGCVLLTIVGVTCFVPLGSSPMFSATEHA